MIDYRPHEYALLPPPMSEQDYAELKASIERDGLLEAIMLYEGRILEGVHRFKVCKELRIEARFDNWHDQPERIKGIGPLRYVIAKNIPRRHLTTQQRADLAVKLVPLLREEAKQRQLAGGLASNEAKGKATEIAAKEVGVSTSTVERALREQRKPESGDDGEAAKKPKLPEQVGEAFSLFRKAKSVVKAFPRDVPTETVDQVANACRSVLIAIYETRAPDKGEPLTDDSLMSFSKHKGVPMRKVPDDWLRWWLKQNPDRSAIEVSAITSDHRERAIALRNLKLWDYITERFKHEQHSLT